MDDLIKRAQAGERNALQELLMREESRIYRFGMKMCGNPEDAKDVLQETLFAMARSVDGFRGDASLSTWLYTIARSFCIKKRRKGKFDPDWEHSIDSDRRGEAAQLLATDKGPEEKASDNQIKVAVEQAIDALETSYREVLWLRDVEGLSAKEVAEVLQLSVAAVKSRLHRARLQVRQTITLLLGIDSTASIPKVSENCPDVTELLSRHIEGDLSPDLCAKMQRHVNSCTRCHTYCDLLKKALNICATFSESEVPLSVQTSVQQAITEYLKKR